MADVLHTEEHLGFYVTNEKGRETAGTLEDSQQRTRDFLSCRKELWGSRRSASPEALLTFSSQPHKKEITLWTISLGKEDQCPRSHNLRLGHKLLSLTRKPGAKVQTPGHPDLFI